MFNSQQRNNRDTYNARTNKGEGGGGWFRDKLWYNKDLLEVDNMVDM